MPLDELILLKVGSGEMQARRRHHLAAWVESAGPPGSLLLHTCLRVELVGYGRAMDGVAREAARRGATIVRGEDAVRHLIRVAVGLESAVVGEDQVLHQLRAAVATSRTRHRLEPIVGYTADAALRSGRRARSWLPSARPSLADVALDDMRVERPGPDDLALVIGAGTMGALAARALRQRGWRVRVANRTPQRAEVLARTIGGTAIALDGLTGLEGAAGVVLAVEGRWPTDDAAADDIHRDARWLVDLSAPPALGHALARRLGDRYWCLDDLHIRPAPSESSLLRRMDGLVEEAVADVRRWTAARADRSAAAVLASQAEELRSSELRTLFRELDGISPEQRASIEAMAERLTTRLMRHPFERLGQDDDGRYARAAQDLFGL